MGPHQEGLRLMTGSGNLGLIPPGDGDPFSFKGLGFGSDLGEGREVVLKHKPGYSNSVLGWLQVTEL